MACSNAHDEARRDQMMCDIHSGAVLFHLCALIVLDSHDPSAVPHPKVDDM